MKGLKAPKNKIDRLLFYLVWISITGSAASLLYVIAKVFGMNPELELLIPLLAFILSSAFLLALKVGRIEGRLEEL